MAIEDAIVLATCVRDCSDVPRAFAAFERLRRPRVERVVAYGARGSSNKAMRGAARVLRDLLMPLVFRHLITAKSVAWLYEHHVDWERPPGADNGTS
jgi:2-polyprenyl-6-methoxyphenol hydroxylase-like FAD-dependent oxidoreductase